MIPYADFTYFVLLLYIAVPTVILGLFGRAGWRWALLVTTVMLVVQYHDALHLRKHLRSHNSNKEKTLRGAHTANDI